MSGGRRSVSLQRSEEEEAEGGPRRLGDAADQGEGEAGGSAQAEGGEDGHVSGFESAQVAGNEESGEADARAERFDGGRLGEGDGQTDPAENEPGLEHADQPGEEVVDD